MMCTARMRIGVDLTLTTVKVTTINRNMAGPGKKPVQVYRTGLPLHWEFLRLRTGFELPSSCVDLP
jgi:hypothetical protein